MESGQQILLLQKREILGLEDSALGEWDCLDLLALQMQDAVHQVKIHVLVHVCLFEALAGVAGSQEEVRLDINAVPSVLLGLHTPLIKLDITLGVIGRSDEMVHVLSDLACIQLVELLEGDGFEGGAVGLGGVDDDALPALHLGLVGSDEGFLHAGAEDDVLGGGLVVLEGVGQLGVEFVKLRH